MANNIFVGPNAVVAKAAGNFVDLGITGANTTIIYRIGASSVSYKPGRAINGVTAFEEGKGYYFVAKQNIDLEAYLVPPLTDIPPVDPPPSGTVERIVWSQFVDATAPDATAIRENGTLPSGATATKKLEKANGNYIEFALPYPNGISLLGKYGLDGENNADYDFDGIAAGMFFNDYQGTNGANLYTSTGATATNRGLVPENGWARLEITNTNDLLIRKSPDRTTWTDAGTMSGALTGMSNLFIKAAFSLPGNNRHIINTFGKGLIAI